MGAKCCPWYAIFYCFQIALVIEILFLSSSKPMYARTSEYILASNFKCQVEEEVSDLMIHCCYGCVHKDDGSVKFVVDPQGENTG